MRISLLSIFILALAIPTRADANWLCWGWRALTLPSTAPERHYALGKRLGKGVTATVYVGKLPAKFAETVEGAPEAWRDGTAVAVKLPNKPDAFRLASLREEFDNAQRVAPHDPKGLFLRCAWDQGRKVVLSEYDPANISLTDWLGRPGARLGGAEFGKVKEQLQEALAILRAAQTVHGDLNPNNILINPTTLAIKIIDLGIAAPPGKYPEALKLKSRDGKPFRGGNEDYASPEQLRNEPARYADDEYTIGRVLEMLRR